jgi:hypothetical protein
MTIIANPDPEKVAKWGPLGYISDDERERILALLFGEFGPAVTRIEKQLKEIAKKEKKRRSESQFKAIHRRPAGA